MSFVNRKKLGNLGETIACKYLEEASYKIIDRNFYFRGGELDIIAYDKSTDELVFIEVKTRSSLRYGTPAEAVNRQKISHIINGAKQYMYAKKICNKKIRFDVVELLYKNKFYINHIKEII